jgi:hypothetical protein
VKKPIIKFCTPFYNQFRYEDIGDGYCIPCRNDPPLPIELSFDALARAGGFEYYVPGTTIETPDFNFRWHRTRGTYIARSRNALVNDNASNKKYQKLKDDYTHYFFVDSDISFDLADVIKLLNYNKPIISGAYQERTHEYCVTGGMINNNQLDFMPCINHGLFDVDWTGAGFLCVQRIVFETLPYKWFTCQDYEYTNENGETCVDGFEEDVTFCRNAWMNGGYHIFLDMDCKVKHHLK